jgi:probable F420-dependent oxidoreductase
MKFGLSLVVRGNDATPETFASIAQRAEELEFDSLWLSAHVILPPQVKSGYVMVPGSMHPEHWKERYWEPFTVMSYLAALTSKLVLGTSVVVLPMHNPFEVAKQVAEVDQLSGGRTIFGVGVGWFEEEFEALGQNYRNRGARTDEALALIRRLWEDEPVTFKGKHYSVENAHFGPKPVQRPGPPIWVAGRSAPALRRTARFGDAFHPARPTFEYMQQARRDLDRFLVEEGRSPGSVPIPAKLRYHELGSDHFVLDIVPETRQVALDTMERFAQEVRGRL